MRAYLDEELDVGILRLRGGPVHGLVAPTGAQVNPLHAPSTASVSEGRTVPPAQHVGRHRRAGLAPRSPWPRPQKPLTAALPRDSTSLGSQPASTLPGCSHAPRASPCCARVQNRRHSARVMGFSGVGSRLEWGGARRYSPWHPACPAAARMSAFCSNPIDAEHLHCVHITMRSKRSEMEMDGLC